MVFLPLLLTGCDSSGPVTTKQYDLAGFTGVRAGNAFKIDINQSNTYSVSIDAPQDWFDHIKVEKSGSNLEVSIDWGFWGFWHGFSNKAGLHVTMPELDSLDISGAATCNATGFSSAHDFNLNLSGACTANLNIKAFDASLTVSGASKLNGQLNMNDIRLNLSGASQADLMGTQSNMNLDCSGASQAKLRDLPAKDVRVELSGASSATITTSGTLDIFVSGASHLDYYGKPSIRQLNISGESKVQQQQSDYQ